MGGTVDEMDRPSTTQCPGTIWWLGLDETKKAGQLISRDRGDGRGKMDRKGGIGK